jgi:hypothetical protein
MARTRTTCGACAPAAPRCSEKQSKGAGAQHFDNDIFFLSPTLGRIAIRPIAQLIAWA